MMVRILQALCTMLLVIHAGQLVGQLSEFDRQGHRGSRGLMPENTIPAMIRAIDLGVTSLEMDVVFTSDGKAVLSHEPYFNHDITTKPDGGYITPREEKNFNIYKMTYAETQKFDVGMKPNQGFPRQARMKAKKPLLEDVIDSVENYIRSKNLPRVFYNIETKTRPSTDNVFHPEPSRFVDMLMEVISKKNMEERVVIQSFDVRTLQYLHGKYPEVKTSLLIERMDKYSVREKIGLLGFTPTVLSPEFGMVNRSLVEYAHSNGMKIIPWTVNTEAGIRKLKNLKVDGIITDYPDLF